MADFLTALVTLHCRFELTLISSSFFLEDFLGVDLAELFVSGVEEALSSSSLGSFLTSTFWSVMLRGGEEA